MCDFPVPRDDEDLELSKHVGWVVDKEYNGGKALQSDRLGYCSLQSIFIHIYDLGHICFPTARREPKEDDNEEESDAV